MYIVLYITCTANNTSTTITTLTTNNKVPQILKATQIIQVPQAPHGLVCALPFHAMPDSCRRYTLGKPLRMALQSFSDSDTDCG